MSDPITSVGTTPAAAGITGITNTIQKIAAPSQEAEAATVDQVKEGSTFGSLFTDLIQNVKDTDAEFTQTQYLLATGQLDNPVQVGISAYKADIASGSADPDAQQGPGGVQRTEKYERVKHAATEHTLRAGSMALE